MTIVYKEEKPLSFWLMGGSFAFGLLLLTWSFWKWAKLPLTMDALLWTIAIVSVVFLVGIFLLAKTWPDGQERQRPTTAAAPHVAPAEAHAPAGAPHQPAAHGHGDHGPDPWAFAKWSVGAGIFIAICLAGAFGLYSLLQTGSNQVREQAGASAPASSSPHQEGVSLDWVPISAPTGDWYTVNGKAGYDIYVCVPSADPNCTAAAPIGFRMRCVLMDGVTELDWLPTGICRNYLRLKLQSTGTAPLPMNYRYVPR